MDREQATRTLASIDDAARLTRRFSINNGIIPLGWGALIIVCLSLYDFLPAGAATTILSTAAALASVWTALYARRLPVQPTPAAAREYTFLFAGWGLYYAAVLIGGQALLQGRLAYPMTAIAIAAAAPLLLGGWRMLRRGR